MYHRWAALVFVLALCAISPASAAGQALDAPPRGRKLGTLGQNHPNPFKPDTFIPFTVEDCNGAGGQRVVSLRIYNVLAQLVAIPMLHGSAKPIANLRLSCGEYIGYWDGTVTRSRRPAAAGVYVYELVVDGERTSKKMFVEK
jgi:hypothetical protein